MAIDSAARRRAMLTVGQIQPCLPLPTGGGIDAQSERYTALGIYGGFSAGFVSVGTSAGSRQRWRRAGLISRA